MVWCLPSSVCLPKTRSIEGRKCNRYHLYLQLPTVLFTDPLRYKKTPRLKQHQHQHCSNCKSMRKQTNLKLEIYEETNKLETGILWVFMSKQLNSSDGEALWYPPKSPLPTNYLWSGQIKNENLNALAMVPKEIWSGNDWMNCSRLFFHLCLCCCPITPASL